ncbi:MAG: class I SAM-dependent methyltransferase [Planctomycetota bacterium]|nr:class I SAM-dependent methyltransferase [Planctomycetota bacterium]
MNVLTDELDPKVVELRARLDAYYQSASDYSAFHVVNEKHDYWKPVIERSRSIAAKKGSCKILEVGAGMTGFPHALGADTGGITFFAQDVTSQNEDHLRSVAGGVYIGDLSEITDQFDIIFSTFVFEHITSPNASLQHMLSMLNPGGSIFIACPRYGFPLYMPPSARHYGRLKQIRVMTSFLAKRLRAWITGKPAFVIHLDPAILTQPSYYIDADAVHWPSIRDIRQSLPDGYSLRRIDLEAKGIPGLLYKTLMLINVEIRKDG